MSRLQLIQKTAGCDPKEALKSKEVQGSWWVFQTASYQSSPSQYSGRPVNLENLHDSAGKLWCRDIKRQYTGGRCRDQVQEFKTLLGQAGTVSEKPKLT